MGADGDGAEIEITLSFGFSRSWLGLDWDLAVAASRYPDGSDVDFVEFPVQVGRTTGPWTWALGAIWAPSGQVGLNDRSNRYGWASATYAPAQWPISFTAATGRERGAWAPDGKWDWRAGAAVPLGQITATVDWVDSDREAGAIVAGVYATF